MLRDLPGSAGAEVRMASVGAGAIVDLHASAVRLGATGVVLLGASGVGKSDLALRLIDAGGELIADDRLRVERVYGRVFGRAPEALAGLIEIRGYGIVRLPYCASCPLGLVVELDPTGPWPRLPEHTTYALLGVTLPHMTLDPRSPSACARIRLALQAERVV